VIGKENKLLHGEVQSNFLLQFEVEDVDKTYNYLRENEIEFVTEPHDRKEWGSRIAHFRDPDKNLIEIYKML
jgi:lactoylglutathione lyase